MHTNRNTFKVVLKAACLVVFITLCIKVVDYAGSRCYYHSPISTSISFMEALALDHSKTVFKTNQYVASKITGTGEGKGEPTTTSTYMSVAHKQQVVSREAEGHRVLVAYHGHTKLI